MVKIMFFNLGIKGLRNLVHLLIIIKILKYLGWDCKTFFLYNKLFWQDMLIINHGCGITWKQYVS
jgi:hypothetical protein